MIQFNDTTSADIIDIFNIFDAMDEVKIIIFASATTRMARDVVSAYVIEKIIELPDPRSTLQFIITLSTDI